MSAQPDSAVGNATLAFLAEPHNAYIGGKFTATSTADYFTVEDPSNGRIIAQLPECDATIVDAAVTAARRALEGPWARIRPADREKMLLDLAAAVERDADLLAEVVSLESGKSVTVARNVEIAGCIDWLRYYAGWATKIEGSTLATSIPVPPGSRHFAMTVREPVGVVGAIVPWNFPLLIAVWKLAPALACGCTIIIKPAEETPLSLLRFARLVDEIGIPSGVVNIVTGRGGTTGSALVNHPGIDKLTFTGSTEVGKLVGHAAVDRMARFTLELGGKSPMIVFADADENSAPLMAGLGMFFNSGQVCTSASRLLIERSVFERTLGSIAAVTDALTLGSGREASAQVQPLLSGRHRERVTNFIDRAVRDGGVRVAGTRPVPDEGFYVAPTIFRGLAPEAELVREEVFGPVVVAIPFDDADEAIRLANDTRYGLAASVWTNDLSRALSVSTALKAGTVWINTHNTLDVNVPFGGYKQSGIGKEHGRAALDAYLENKTIIMRYT
ncbi:aldehyde dehydrogenase family protein [Methylobacterium oryzisoli]|uniref:aldehyde dehydrogenase family protein n=1 Tax=Methylobacterium oryzisoli TaxID=3385502 RepID=UPI003891E0BA